MTQKISRREFLRLATVTAGSAILAACAPSPTPTAAPTAAATSVPPTQAVVVAAKDRLKALGFMPGAADHAKGWETILPNVATPANADPIVIKGAKRVEIGDVGVNDDPQTSPSWQVSMELFKIDWQVAWTAVAADMGTKYSLAMASGELPDWMEEIPQSIYVQMLEAGSLADITDAWNNSANADWMKKPLDTYLDGKAAYSYAKVGDRLMAFPMAERAANNAKVLHIRKDWLDQLSLDVPETLDDVKAVALAFKEANLGTGPTQIGLNMCKSIGRGPSWGGGGWYASADAVTGAYGVISAQWAKDADGKLVQSDILPQMKDALAVLRDWYASGVIPIDFFTLDDANAMTVTAGNQVGLVYAPAWGAQYPIQDSLANDPAAKWIWTPIPTLPGGKRGNLGELPYFIINGFRSGFENAGRAMEAFSWWVELFENPDDRMHGWEKINTIGGVPGFQWNGDVVSSPADAATSPAHRPGFGPHWMRGGTYMDTYADAHLNSLIETWADVPAEQQDAMQTFLLTDPDGTVTSYRQAYGYTTSHDAEDDIFDQYHGLPTPGMQSSQTSLDGLRSEAFYAIIKGDKPLDAFEDFVSQWKSAGGDQITTEVNDWLQKQ